MSFLEMLDVLNEELTAKGEEPVAFDSDCREGICGMCGLVINGKAHGPRGDDDLPAAHALVQRRRRRSPSSRGGPTAFPVIRDLVVDRTALRPDHPGRRLHLGQHRLGARGPRRAGARSARPTGPSTRPPASAAAPASRRARTPRRCCSWAPRSPTSPSCRRASRSAYSRGREHGRPARRTRASAAAPTSATARTSAPRRSRSTSSPSSTGTCAWPCARAGSDIP